MKNDIRQEYVQRGWTGNLFSRHLLRPDKGRTSSTKAELVSQMEWAYVRFKPISAYFRTNPARALSVRYRA